MRRGLRVLLISDSFISLALGLIGPIYAIFVAEIGGDILDASYAYFAYMFTAGIVMYMISKWENRFRQKEKLIVIGYSLNTLGCLMYIFVYNQPTLLITQIVLGIAIAILDPAFDSVYSHYVTRSREASDWGTWESMSYITTALAAIIGGYIASTLGFTALFIGMFTFSLLGTARSLTLFRKKVYLMEE